MGLYFSSWFLNWHGTYTGRPKKSDTPITHISVMICQFKRKSSIKDLFKEILAKHLEVICAKDGRYIFINEKVMDISVSHAFKAIYMNFNRNVQKAHFDLESLNFGDQYWKSI